MAADGHALCCQFPTAFYEMQEVGHQMADSRQALATKLAELKEQSAGLRQQYVK